MSAHEVLESLDEARRLAARYLPEAVQPGVSAVVDALRRPESVKAVELLGAVGLARAHAWWESVLPFTEPRTFAASALDSIYDRGVERVDRRDAEIAAFSAVSQALMEIGWESAKVALPFIIAALRR